MFNQFNLFNLNISYFMINIYIYCHNTHITHMTYCNRDILFIIQRGVFAHKQHIIYKL